jgi:hypothetical protein
MCHLLADCRPERQALSMEDPSQFRMAKIRIEGRTIECSTAEVRSLLLAAKTIGDDESACRDISIGRLMMIKDACQLYSLGRLQRIVYQVIKRRDTSGVTPAPAR